MPTPLVIIPTYNERGNIVPLVSKIFEHVPNAGILVVDDASPDGTADAVNNITGGKRKAINLIQRPGKMGLGSAYVEGFKYALEQKDKFDPIIQMDADGSHDPAALPLFLKALETSDIAVGSRYGDGIRVMNWPWARLLLSTAANRYARMVTGVPVSDLTGGFNGIRRSLLGKIDPATLRSNGYAFQIELKYRAYRLGAAFSEVPIVFSGRIEGKSKLSRKVVLEAVVAVWLMRLGRWKTAVQD